MKLVMILMSKTLRFIFWSRIRNLLIIRAQIDGTIVKTVAFYEFSNAHIFGILVSWVFIDI